VVGVLEIGPKVLGFKSRRGLFVREIKIRSTTFFGEKVKPSVPCRKILRHVKEPYSYEKRYFVSKIYGNFSPSFSCVATRYFCWLLPESFGG
jgi:hypothetical protein